MNYLYNERMREKHKYWSFLLVAFFVLSCGNPWIQQAEGNFIWVIAAVFSLFYIYRKKNKLRHLPSLWKYVGVTLLIFIAQFFVFGWNTFSGIVNFECKIITGATIFIALGESFKYKYLNLMFYLSIIALLFWLLQLQGIYFDWFPVKGFEGWTTSIIVYFHRLSEPTRNQGAFWEPGAYGIYLNMTFLLFITSIEELTRHKIKFLVIAISVLTTQSTTAYICFGVMVMLYFAIFTHKWYVRIMAPLALVGAVIVYESAPFLQEKINDQQEAQAEDLSSGFSSTRMGSALFDLQIIKTHPIIGNGLHERTLYRDFPWLATALSRGDYAASGNGLSRQCAKMGVAFYFIFLWLLYKNNRGLKRWEYWSFVGILFMMAWGEDIFNYSFFLCLPFAKLVSDKRLKIISKKS